jgi:hypothetical protein
MNVKRTDERAVIEGVRGFSPAEYASSVHGSQARILETLGESLTYEDLLCYSGFAFRTGIHELMCPSAGHPCCGYMCLDNGHRALPWKLRLFESFPWSVPRPEEERRAFETEVRDAIKASIDRGVPVHYGGEEDGLIVGYGDEGRRWWCLHPYHERGAEAFWFDEVGGFAGCQGKWPWGIVVWLEPKARDDRVAARALTRAALEQAVDMWVSDAKHDDAYFSGDAAYGHWLGWLRGVEEGEVEKPESGLLGNGWCYAVLNHGRSVAAEWLRAKADGYEGVVRDRLRLAADHYRQLVDGCMAGVDDPWALCPGPQKADEWTSEMRRTQIARLEAAREHDRSAIAAITEALAAPRRSENA